MFTPGYILPSYKRLPSREAPITPAVSSAVAHPQRPIPPVLDTMTRPIFAISAGVPSVFFPPPVRDNSVSELEKVLRVRWTQHNEQSRTDTMSLVLQDAGVFSLTMCLYVHHRGVELSPISSSIWLLPGPVENATPLSNPKTINCKQ
jgi:hypothetical protein